jgi:hypothetical protein
VGAVKQTVARKSPIVCSSVSGVSRSTSTVEAPNRSGKQSIPPSPKVNASGGVPQNTSSRVGFRHERGKASHIAITSRWKCMQPFGCPVVPEVNAISATSSAAVSTVAKSAGLRSSAASREPRPPSLKHMSRVRPAQRAAAISSSSFNRASQSAAPIRALSRMTSSSFARRSGIVATAMQPALMTPNQHAAIIGLFGPRSSTRLPGTSFRSSVSTRAIWLARTRSWR